MHPLPSSHVPSCPGTLLHHLLLLGAFFIYDAVYTLLECHNFSILGARRLERPWCAAGQHVLDWSPLEYASGKSMTLCPMCGGFGEQICLNCIGEGVVVPLVPLNPAALEKL